MIWLKSVGSGLAALLIFAVVGAVIYSLILNKNSGTQGLVGVDWLSLLKASPWLWLLLLLVFAGGFAWQYRRLA